MTAPLTADLVYADSSALVKLLVEEPETAALRRAVRGLSLATSSLATVEVGRAVAIALPDDASGPATDRLLGSCLQLDVTAEVLADARALSSPTVRTLDAIHLATARLLEVRTVLTYDRRMIGAAAGLGLRAVHPGAR